ncbi:probable high-affinity phosphate permease, phosphate-repressible [Rhynchosporium agropyri]|uniref:Probable high-affinity phosphate permease, phosphate-repressible n=1 Tax=Rhynchosporium agropyri TaxID=914238 RepID=A0A1E1LJB9_9HELO|nr:probable high-affinity phosphate permease, phosphate-repressible [Rhynchosporium agropyri]
MSSAAMNKTDGGNNAFHTFNNDFAHIQDPNERRRLALAEIDKAPFGWYHVRACVVAGIGFFTDSYDIFAINLVTSMLGIVYFNDKKSHGTIPPSSDTAIKVSTSGGTVIGQLGFGYLADVVGRKRMYGLELIIIIFATLAQALNSNSRAISITGLIIFWRVLMGIGIGGDYPLSSVITSEFATTKWRGAMMNAVLAMQGIGQLTAAILALIVTTGFKGSLESAANTRACTGVCQLAVDKMWRIIIGFGAVPGCIALYYRLTIPETPRYTFDVARDVEEAGTDVKAYMNGKAEGHPDEIARVTAMAQTAPALEIPKPPSRTSATSSWFFLDVAFYGLGLNNSIILAAIGWTGGATQYEIFRKNAIGNLILVCAGAIPGYWLSGHALLALYVLAQFFFNFGPNSTTFIVPGECCPTRYRATSHGFSAASGKVGAIIAQVVFGPLRTRGALPNAKGRDASPWLNHIMYIFALFMLCGLFTSFLIPETKRKTLEELAGEVPGYVPFGLVRTLGALTNGFDRTPNFDPALIGGAHRAYSEEDSQGEKHRGVDSV